MDAKKFSVTFFDCDSSAHLRISKLCEFFQETALTNLSSQGLDYVSMVKKDKFSLVISRVKLRISHLPLLGEDVFIKMWLRGYNPDKVAWGDYDVRDAFGNSIIQATSSWLLIDLRTGKAIPFTESPYKFAMHPEATTMPDTYNLNLLEPSGMPRTALVKNIKYSDIDFNNHVNNCRYADWILDAIDMEDIKEKQVRSVQLNYIKEIEYNAKIALMRFPETRHHIVIFGVNEEHPEQVHFQARIGFDKEFILV